VQGVEHLEDLRLVLAGKSLAVAPVDNLEIVSAFEPRSMYHPDKSLTLTTGFWKLLASWANFLRASVSLLAPLMMVEILLGPTYSRMVLTWSAVGGFSVMSRSNSSDRRAAEWSLAWSAVAGADELADTCFSRVTTLAEAGEPALEKRVMISRVLRCGGV
jgi:hypothetical protein